MKHIVQTESEMEKVHLRKKYQTQITQFIMKKKLNKS